MARVQPASALKKNREGDGSMSPFLIVLKATTFCSRSVLKISLLVDRSLNLRFFLPSCVLCLLPFFSRENRAAVYRVVKDL